MNTLPRKELIIFYSLSLAISWPFMIWMQFFGDSWNSIPLPQPLKTSLFMWGPGVSALLCWKLMNNRNNLRRYFLFSGGRIINIAIYTAPMILFIAMFHGSLTASDMLFFLTLYNIVSFLNTFGEELGWRGFLQPNLGKIPVIKRFLILGLMWEFWHLPMRVGALYNGANSLYIALFSLGTVLITYLIGFYTERTKSVSVAVSLHVALNSAFSLSAISKVPQQDLVPYFILVFTFYTATYFLWHKIAHRKLETAVVL